MHLRKRNNTQRQSAQNKPTSPSQHKIRPKAATKRSPHLHPSLTPQTASKRHSSYKPPSVEQIGQSKLLGGMRLVLLGAPGCGKGSFSKYISAYYKIPTISTGDLIRAEIKKNSPLGLRVKDIASSGGLVDDILIMQMLEQRLEAPDTSNGYILDGFPRTLPQAKALIDLSHHPTTVFHPPNIVLNINLREDVNIAKALGRRVCGDCNTGYNVAHIVEESVQNGQIGQNAQKSIPGMFMPAILPLKSPDHCDPCGGKLVTRVDDTKETIATRLQIYNTSTKPLVDFYSEQGILSTWEVVRGLEDTPKLLNMLDEKLLELGFMPSASL